MDPFSIFIDNIPPNLTYGQIKGAFWPFQQLPPLLICKKEKYVIVTFEKEETVQDILRVKDHITLKGHKVNIKQAYKQFKPTFVHIPPSFLLPPEVLVPLPPPPPPPPIVLLPPFFVHTPPPPAPAPYEHPYPRDFHTSFINSSQLVYLFSCLLCFVFNSFT